MCSCFVILVVPFVLQLFAAVGLVGYPCFKNGQQAVNNLANQLMKQAGDRVDDRLDSYLNFTRSHQPKGLCHQSRNP